MSDESVIIRDPYQTTTPGPTKLTPFLDRDTIARITTDDFPLEQRDVDELYDPVARDQLELALREVVGGFERVAVLALAVWRERRGLA